MKQVVILTNARNIVPGSGHKNVGCSQNTGCAQPSPTTMGRTPSQYLPLAIIMHSIDLKLDILYLLGVHSCAVHGYILTAFGS